MKNEPRLRIAAIFLAALLGGCTEAKTGSNGTGSVPTEKFEALVAATLLSAEPFSTGVAQIELGAANVGKDDDPNAGSGALRLGMSFEGAGTVLGSLDAAPAILREAVASSAVRGPVAAVDPTGNRFTVGTLVVDVDANTLYDGVAGIAALEPGASVEVAGLPLAQAGRLLATRVTRVDPGDGRVSVPVRRSLPLLPGSRAELEGIVVEVRAGGAFVLRNAARDYAIAPNGVLSSPLTPGARVRVTAIATSATELIPTAVTVVSGQITYRVTGAVSEFSSLSALRVRGEPVDLTTAVIRGGDAAAIGNGRRLSVVGTAGPGALRVSEATLQP